MGYGRRDFDNVRDILSDNTRKCAYKINLSYVIQLFYTNTALSL